MQLETEKDKTITEKQLRENNELELQQMQIKQKELELQHIEEKNELQKKHIESLKREDSLQDKLQAIMKQMQVVTYKLELEQKRIADQSPPLDKVSNIVKEVSKTPSENEYKKGEPIKPKEHQR
ncbi:hypothetical protein Fokcrypt_00545 [Candidatus Fokinia cryptica]|uniref:Uncharacterized protein n=2 Tax=Candidatus Fokinia crypta TaxID=1920990 RepID=A0ABZ0UQS9_9RICK|nr:hypothetical protein Fokcrypt_00545 [Candidatus Fokinia cryptica]